jgi:hypothetical protein
MAAAYDEAFPAVVDVRCGTGHVTLDLPEDQPALGRDRRSFQPHPCQAGSDPKPGFLNAGVS